MTARKLCGFDINGWRDFVAKNWRTVPGEEEEVGPVQIIESAPYSSVVKVGEDPKSFWIGGPQADIAPHGLGGGWGEVGQENRKTAVRALLELKDLNTTKLAACFTGSAQGGKYNVVSIDEGIDGSEAVQEHLLSALATAKISNGSLVWRPVLSALYAIDKNLALEGQTVGVVSHCREGLTVQKLRILSARDVLAPERRMGATFIPCDVGYEYLVEAAQVAAIGPEKISSRNAHRLKAKSVGRAALGLGCRPEILRLQNGDWEVLDMGKFDAAEKLKGPSQNFDLSGCDLILLETLSEGNIKKLLSSFVKREASVPVEVLPAAAVAEAALLAAQRASNGLPIFFDFLPRLSTIINGPTGPINFDLIRPEETLEAGRMYRSPEPACLAIPAGQKNVSVFLRKEASPRPRKAKVEFGLPLNKQAEVVLWVEQKPTSGRAKILMDAPSLGRQFTVDWSEAQEDERTWNEIIEELETKTSIPNRLVLPCGMYAWEDNGEVEGLNSLLETELNRHETDWSLLANKMMQRPFGQYCISSDGDIPEGIDPKSIERLDLLTEKAIGVTKRRLHGKAGLGVNDNKALQFLTWQFRRCPAEVADWLLDCIEARSNSHPFIKGAASWVLIYQGLGRIVSDDETQRQAIALMLSSNIANWVWRNESAGMAFMLSRSDTAPLHLERSDVEKLSQRTVEDFKRNIGSEYTTFSYAPFLLAGLLRWRLKEKNALLFGIDPLADELFAVVRAAESDLNSRHQGTFNFQRARTRFLPILQDLKAELQGEGNNPDLLIEIYGK